MPNYVFRWIVDFLTDRTQCTKVGLNVSLSLDINSSIVQGSGIGPGSLFVVYISDLKASGKDNCIIKFAEAICSLLVPEFADLSIEQEIVLIREWAVKIK